MSKLSNVENCESDFSGCSRFQRKKFSCLWKWLEQMYKILVYYWVGDVGLNLIPWMLLRYACHGFPAWGVFEYKCSNGRLFNPYTTYSFWRLLIWFLHINPHRNWVVDLNNKLMTQVPSLEKHLQGNILLLFFFCFCVICICVCVKSSVFGFFVATF
jgi:hypothetical protein